MEIFFTEFNILIKHNIASEHKKSQKFLAIDIFSVKIKIRNTSCEKFARKHYEKKVNLLPRFTKDIFLHNAAFLTTLTTIFKWITKTCKTVFMMT